MTEQEPEYNEFNVDIPSEVFPECPDCPGTPWLNVGNFPTAAIALQFAQERFGADHLGRVCLVSPAPKDDEQHDDVISNLAKLPKDGECPDCLKDTFGDENPVDCSDHREQLWEADDLLDTLQSLIDEARSFKAKALEGELRERTKESHV